MLIGKRPRIRICTLPTPLEEAPRLSEALGGPRILIKRDDLTGLALGGNKARKLEFLAGDAIAVGADVLITCGGAQSNHVRQTAAAAARLGLKAYLVLGPGEHEDVQGNILLDGLLGAEIRWLDTNDNDAQWQRMESIAREVEAEGHRALIIPKGGASVSGSAAYANCLLEIIQQLADMGVDSRHLFVATGTGGTQAGLVVGARWMMPPDFQVVGVSVLHGSDVIRAVIARHASQAAEALGAPFRFDPEDVTVYDQYVGEGYGKATAGGLEAIRLFARTEGILLDPVYTAKGAAGMIDMIRRGVLGKDDTVVFLHTGGAPALFAYHRELREGLGL